MATCKEYHIVVSREELAMLRNCLTESIGSGDRSVSPVTEVRRKKLLSELEEVG